MIYIVIFILLFFLAWKFDYYEIKSHEKTWYYISLIILILLAGLRYRVGADTISYMRDYDILPPINKLNLNDFKTFKKEPLWLLFNSICKFFTPKFYLVQLIHASFINIVIFRFLKKNTSYFFTSILFYYILFYNYFNMEIMRESIAISLFLLGIKPLIENNLKRYYFFNVLALFFHYGAIVLFFFPLLIKIKLNMVSFIVSIILIAFLYLYGLNFVIYLFSSNEYIVHKILFYKANTLNFNGVTFYIIRELIFPLASFLLLVKYYHYKHSLNKLSFIYLFIGLVTVFFTGFYRLLNYFSIPMLIYISYISVYFFKHKNLFRKVFAIFIVVSILIFHIFSIIKDTSLVLRNTRYYIIWYPYYSIFNEKLSKERELFQINFMQKSAEKRRLKPKILLRNNK